MEGRGIERDREGRNEKLICVKGAGQGEEGSGI